MYEPGQRPPGSFIYTQPLNTTILGQYGHSDPVYPSRMFFSSLFILVDCCMD